MKKRFNALMIATMFAMSLMTTAAAVRAETAADAVKNVAKGMQENNPAALWEAMPAGYQSDVNGLVQLFGNSMDANLYNQSFALAARVNKLMKNKKTFILNSPMLEAAPNKAELEKNWDGIVTFMNTLVTSDISKIDNLKKMDVGKYLATTGKTLMTQAEAMANTSGNADIAEMKEKLAKMTATVVEEKDGGVVAVKIETEGEEPKTEDFVQVEGKWVPKEMADNWADSIAQAKEAIGKLNDPSDQEAAQGKMMATMMIGAVNGVVGQLEQAKTQEEFNAALEQIGQMLGGLAGGGPGAL